MVDEKASHLLQVLNDVNREELITKLNQIKENNDNHISHLFLEDYFRNKDVHVSSDIYHYEAQCIVNIFPQYSVEYIQSMLETLGSETNRVIVILRQLLKNEPIKYSNKIVLNEHKHTTNDRLPEYVFSQATTSNDIFGARDVDSRHNSSLKRKYKIEQPLTVPKIKIKPLASICKTAAVTQNEFIPETYTSFPTRNRSQLLDMPDLSYLKHPLGPVVPPTRNQPIISFPEEVHAHEPVSRAVSWISEISKEKHMSNISLNNQNENQTLKQLEKAESEYHKDLNNRVSLESAPGSVWHKSKPSSDTATMPHKKLTVRFESVPTVIEKPAVVEQARQIPSQITVPANVTRNFVYEDMFEVSSEDETDSYPSFDEQEVDDNDECPSESNLSYDTKLVSRIMEMFPDASSAYVKQLCIGKDVASPSDIDSVLQIILSNPNYPRRKEKEASPGPELDLEEQVVLLKEILPDADPNYIQYHAELYLHDKEKLKEFMSNAVELKNYPTRKEYLRKQQLSAQVKQYTTEFNVEKFLELIPDPDAYFNDPNKKSSLVENDRIDVFSLHYARGFLKNLYPCVSVKTINAIMTKHKDCLVPTVKELDDIVSSGRGLLKSRRKSLPVDNTSIQNIPLLQEVAYLSHRDAIRRYIEENETKEKEERELAKQNGLLRTCNCCFSDEVMPKNIVKCENGCDFCSDCVKSSAEILFGEGKLDFPCLQDCGSFFSLQTLKHVLSPKMFSKMAQKKQLEEVKAAGIDELEMCPFCDFATIPAPGDKLFRCLNPECMKESCRQCKEPSHVPLRCDEIEKDDDVKRRTYIENKMTEALIRVCYKCGMKFIKADGCNKMTCSCGAMMCYVCGEPVTDYKHFNGQGGDRYHLCPLYSDTDKLHKEAVIKGAEQAKVEVGVANDPTKLKIDPTADLHHHYKRKRKSRSHPIDTYGAEVARELNAQFPNLHGAGGMLTHVLLPGRRHHQHHHHSNHYRHCCARHRHE